MSLSTRTIAGKDSFDRMNYLYQASKLLANVAQDSEKPNIKSNANFLSTYYSNLLINVAKKSVLRIDASIKRGICKGCRGMLVPGKTAKVRFRKKPEKHLRLTCLQCQTSKVYNTDNKDYCIWSENPIAEVETIIFRGGEDADNNYS